MTHFTNDYEQGMKDQRERIIQHLKDSYAKLQQGDLGPNSDDYLQGWEHAIFALEGEQ